MHSLWRRIILLIASLTAPLALAAIAIASALAPQRFSASTATIALGATAIASLLARQRFLTAALATAPRHPATAIMGSSPPRSLARRRRMDRRGVSRRERLAIESRPERLRRADPAAL
jgi:hypothetical protein